jgi:hypothetical protein
MCVYQILIREVGVGRAPRTSDGNDNPTSEALAAAIKREAPGYVAKAVITTAAGVMGIAGLGLWIYVKQFLPQLAGGVPPGAVMAFDLPSGCPAGWKVFEAAISRTIVGATLGQAASPNHDENGKLLSSRLYRKDGGEERHTLTVDEMPAHRHLIPHKGADTAIDAGQRGTNWGVTTLNGTENTDPVGGGAAHNIMPPFIALVYCLKDG